MPKFRETTVFRNTMHDREFIEEDEFKILFENDFTILDLRSESEFTFGNFPGALNHPLLINNERSEVGKTYKDTGKESAINLGHKIVSGEKKEVRIARWREILSASSNRCLYCARGGLRSKISQQWLAEDGVNVPRIRGGYKSLRQYLLRQNTELPAKFEFKIISGKTGSGKTSFLSELSKHRAVIDLEHLARHRGSAFGDVFGGQPSQSNFENGLATALWKAQAQTRNESRQSLFVESESRRIGRCFIPDVFWNSMTKAEIFIIDEPLEKRVENILNDYVSYVFKRIKNSELVDDPIESFGNYLLSALQSISKHLGSERYLEITKSVRSALDYQRTTEDISQHREWIRSLLKDYYDPHYEKHTKRYERVRIRGTSREVWDEINATN